jgi:flavorubredoxin
MITNAQSGTRVDEVAPSIYRVSTPVSVVPGGFSFNQYLIVDEDPLLFHTGPRRMFPLVLNELLAAAPKAQSLCSRVAAMVSVNDLADRPPRALGDGETVALGRARVRWLDTPHLPHGWECGYLYEEATGTLLCGDLFTQPGATHPPLTEGDILGPSEAMRAAMDYFAHSADTRALLAKLAATSPRTLACMHGSAWSGDGRRLLLDLADALVPVAVA